MDCPRCGLVNPPNAARCDCGHTFKTQVGGQEPPGITYTLGPEDFFAADVHSRRIIARTRDRPFSLLLRYGVPALVVTLGALAVAWVVGDVMVAVLLLALAACWPIGRWVLRRWVLRHGRFPRWLQTGFYRRGEWKVRGELSHLAVEEDGLLRGDHRIRWSTFQKAIATQHHLFLYMENVVGHIIVPEPGNPALIWGVIIVPRSLVSGDFDDFLRQVRGHVAVLDVA